MRTKAFVRLSLFSILAFTLQGCATHSNDAAVNPSRFEATVPNGNSPAKFNPPRAPMNDTPELRAGWNHGNDVLWVRLRPNPYGPDDIEKDGSLRVKFGWWKGYPGKLRVEGRRLDAPAPSLRCSINEEQHDDHIGFLPSYLYFPTEGYWEITGHTGDKSVTFVVRVINVTVPNGSSPDKANAPHPPMNDALRADWNHGNGVLWVNLPPRSELGISESARETDGFYRVKFPWWRGVPGKFTVTGRRLDFSAPPLRSSIPPVESYGPFGHMACYLYFPTDGYWEITGHLDDKSLTFIVHVVRVKD